mgnify:CR=1 FL=1
MASIADYIENPEPLLASVCRMFAFDGAAKEIAAIVSAKPEIEQSSYDNWNGGTYGYALLLALPVSLYAQVKTDKDQLEISIKEKTNECLIDNQNCFLEVVLITPEISATDDWRDKAKAWLSGQGINNQGRVRSDNIASRTHDGLLFRSQPEINLYKAIKAIGISFAPLPVFVRGGKEYSRIEPDFVLIKDGVVLVVEVDGDTVHTESPVEAHNRTAMLAHEGAYIERVRASECKTDECATSCASRLLAIIQKHKLSR